MGEAATTVFTILLFIVAFLGSGAYAVLSLADFRAARIGFWATAISFAAIGLVMGIMTTWPLPVRIAICASFFAGAGGGLIWILDYLNARQGLSASEMASKTTIPTGAYQRPWIELIQVVAGPLKYDSQGARLGISVQIKNAGESPATNVRFDSFVYLIGQEHMDVLGEQRKFCAKIRLQKFIGGETVFQGKETSLQNSLPVLKAELDQYSFKHPNLPMKFISPVLVGCLTYKAPFDQSVHQTGFAYSLAEGTAPGSVVSITIPSGGFAVIPPPPEGGPRSISLDRGDIPLGRVSLTPWVEGGFFVD